MDANFSSCFYDKTGYKFNDERLLKQALTHSSFTHEGKNGYNNERLEFLGDSVLSVIVSAYLYHNYPNLSEGDLSKFRASLVRSKSLSDFALSIDLGSMLFLGKGEDQSGGRFRKSLLEDAFEAVIGAIYLDSGYEDAEKFIMRFIPEAIKKIGGKTAVYDYKTMLQEIIQQNPEEKISYVLIGQKGPDHDKEFSVELRLNSNVISKGTGKSKKSAEQNAAKQALVLMGEDV
ncbi:MAG: ribonuclease III [Oscillospiraceae bacterium]|nr:ribonuclease III [Oscillospiraceae bacterium]